MPLYRTILYKHGKSYRNIMKHSKKKEKKKTMKKTVPKKGKKKLTKKQREKIDMNKNGRLDKQDFKMLPRSKKK